jgi:hypothetical protein
MEICQTPRLLIRQFNRCDADYVRRQLNEPSWLLNIGDRGIRTLADAEAFIESLLMILRRITTWTAIGPTISGM